MTHPIWTEFQSMGSDPDWGEIYMGQWKGLGRTGDSITVPCIFTERDVEANTPAELEIMKEQLRENGLQSWYDAEEWAFYQAKDSSYGWGV